MPLPRNRRVMPPSSPSHVTMVQDRRYSGGVAFTDVVASEADVLVGNGWSLLARSVGPTSQRPSPIDADMHGAVPAGWTHYDTTLEKLVVSAKDGTWRDPATGNAV